MIIKKETKVRAPKDSGDRTAFSTGASKDMAPGRGRYDLVPFIQLNRLISIDMEKKELSSDEKAYCYQQATDCLSRVLNCADKELSAVAAFQNIQAISGLNYLEVVEELSKVYERGLIKYPKEREWELGRPTDVYVSSAIRHLTQHLQGLTDENHIVAALWNVVSIYHTLTVYKGTDLVYQNPHTKCKE